MDPNNFGIRRSALWQYKLNVGNYTFNMFITTFLDLKRRLMVAVTWVAIEKH